MLPYIVVFLTIIVSLGYLTIVAMADRSPEDDEEQIAALAEWRRKRPRR